MRQIDPNLAIQIKHDIAEVGGVFVCDVTRSPADGETNEGGRGQVRAVRISLTWYTEGRGDTDEETVHTEELPVDEFGMASGQVVLRVPPTGPISYDGHYMRVLWKLTAQTDIKLAIDQRSEADVLVVPQGGLGMYTQPHPLRTQQ